MGAAKPWGQPPARASGVTFKGHAHARLGAVVGAAVAQLTNAQAVLCSSGIIGGDGGWTTPAAGLQVRR